MALLSVSDLDVSLDGTHILKSVSFAVEAGTFVGLIGPNGSGKTTLLRAIGRMIGFDGQIELDGRPVETWSDRERARRLAMVRQAPSLTFDFTVKELVLLGRTPHAGWMQSYTPSDRARVEEALAQVDLQGFEKRSVLSLSGGEMQRVFLAQALVQEAGLLLLDEPTAHLDVHYQYAFMDRVKRLVEEGKTACAVVHNLELAARYAERLLVMDRGRLVADGPPAEVLTPAVIAEVFGMTADVDRDTDGRLRIEYKDPVMPYHASLQDR